MAQATQSPQINVSSIKAGGGIAGTIFTLASMLIFLIGIPALRYFLPAAIVLGLVVALIIHVVPQRLPVRMGWSQGVIYSARTPFGVGEAKSGPGQS
jgi:hypothetical protein